MNDNPIVVMPAKDIIFVAKEALERGNLVNKQQELLKEMMAHTKKLLAAYLASETRCLQLEETVAHAGPQLKDKESQ